MAMAADQQRSISGLCGSQQDAKNDGAKHKIDNFVFGRKPREACLFFASFPRSSLIEGLDISMNTLKKFVSVGSSQG